MKTTKPLMMTLMGKDYYKFFPEEEQVEQERNIDHKRDNE